MSFFKITLECDGDELDISDAFKSEELARIFAKSLANRIYGLYNSATIKVELKGIV